MSPSRQQPQSTLGPAMPHPVARPTSAMRATRARRARRRGRGAIAFLASVGGRVHRGARDPERHGRVIVRLDHRRCTARRGTVWAHHRRVGQEGKPAANGGLSRPGPRRKRRRWLRRRRGGRGGGEGEGKGQSRCEGESRCEGAGHTRGAAGQAKAAAKAKAAKAAKAKSRESRRGEGVASPEDGGGAVAAPAAEPRRFAWAPVDGAVAYHVELFKGSDRVLAKETKEPILELGPSWRYEGTSRAAVARHVPLVRRGPSRRADAPPRPSSRRSSTSRSVESPGTARPVSPFEGSSRASRLPMEEDDGVCGAPASTITRHPRISPELVLVDPELSRRVRPRVPLLFRRRTPPLPVLHLVEETHGAAEGLEPAA